VDFFQIIQGISVYGIPVLFAITVHEAAHGYAARYFGDPTAELMGRITLNPLKHIDLIGTVIVPLGLYLATAGAFMFGYAKPVPVDFGNLRNPKSDMIWVALAGPAVNLAQALGWGILFYLFSSAPNESQFIEQVCKAGILVNVVMFVFNLFPLPPMDGGRILVGLLPMGAARTVARIEPYGFFIVLALLLAGIISALWMRPLMGLTYEFLDLLLLPVRWLVT
jgi:Zn-dependent protease